MEDMSVGNIQLEAQRGKIDIEGKIVKQCRKNRPYDEMPSKSQQISRDWSHSVCSLIR